MLRNPLAWRGRLLLASDEVVVQLPGTCPLVGGLTLDRQARVERPPRRAQVVHVTCLIEQGDVGEMRAPEVGRLVIRLDCRRGPLLRAPGLAAVVDGVTGAPPASPPLCAPDETATRPRLAAVPARREPDPASAASTGGSTLSRSLGFTPAASEILTLTQPTTPTPRQLRAEAAARERSRLDDAVSDLMLDDITEPGDGLDANEVPDV